jgi:putative CocE/NonD family hydrolase
VKIDRRKSVPNLRYALARIASIVRPPVEITPPPCGVRFDRDVEVRTRDGTTLRVNLFRPADGDPFPIVMCAHPYGKDALPKRRGRRYEGSIQYRMLRQAAPVRFSAWTTWESPDPGFWCAHGYAVVNCDLRGFGRSEGTGELCSHQEA